MEVYLKGKRIWLDPKKAIGKGMEADIYLISRDKVAKIYKPPGHPDYQGLSQEQAGAKLRIKEIQRKLPAFPARLPSRVVVPQALLTNKQGTRIRGYLMNHVNQAEQLMRYADKDFRLAGVSHQEVVSIFRDLWQTVSGIHQRGVVIGDFNDLNVLIKGDYAYIIDADSFQYQKWLCRMFTARFLDPLLCGQGTKELILGKPYVAESDWYAFSAMLMQCLLFVDPYGGIYRPKKKNHKIPQSKRPLHRITVFHKEVRYPKPAIPYNTLPDDLLQYWYEVFTQDKRSVFPVELLEDLNWSVCSKCQTEHTRSVCPSCQAKAPGTVKEVITVRGRVQSKIVFETNGLILFAQVTPRNLQLLYYENQEFKRETGSVVTQGTLDPRMRFRVSGKRTLIGFKGQLAVLSPDQSLTRVGVDSFGTLPLFDANQDHYYWAVNGQLYRDGQLGPYYMGDVLSNQTLFWTGEKFGFGFYRAGELNVAFIFDAKRKGINDSLDLPPIRGQLIDSTCFFSRDLCWFIIATQISGQTIHDCVLIQNDGTVLASTQARTNDGSWLGKIRGKCAVGDYLLCATDDGIVRLEPSKGKITIAREFPDTEPFVHTGCHLFPGADGLYVVSRQRIHKLKIT